MQRLKVGVIGAGGIAQIEHIPNLMKLKRQFEILGVCDPSAKARDFVSEEFGLATFESMAEVLALPLDAAVIASPDPLHHEQILAALERGFHVFCEKPLCYAPGDIDALIAARDRARKVLQVGYMKRFDPSYEAAPGRMPGTAKTLRYVSVEVNDPDAWPFIKHHAWRQGDDVVPELIASLKVKQQEQVARAVPVPLDDMSYRGFTAAYCSSLVHDVNAVHGLLDGLGVPDGEIAGAQLFAGGEGGQGAVRLLGGRALWNMVHLKVPALADYSEKITFYFDEGILELEFPSPWLNHQPTRLTVKKSNGNTLVREDVRTGYGEAFIEELKGFWSAIVDGKDVRNTAEQARRDMKLLCELAQFYAGGHS
jgi:predicted dehydrogenase